MSDSDAPSQPREIELGILETDKREQWMPQLAPGLFVSGVAAAGKKDVLQEHNIKCILTANCRPNEFPAHREQFQRELGIEYLKFQLVDNKEQVYKGAFSRTMTTIEKFSDPKAKDYQPTDQDFNFIRQKAREAKARGEGFLTHCTRGQRRSMFLNFALLVDVWDKPLRDAIIAGYKARPRTEMWQTMIDELVEFAARIGEERHPKNYADLPKDFFVEVETQSSRSQETKAHETKRPGLSYQKCMTLNLKYLHDNDTVHETKNNATTLGSVIVGGSK